MSNVIDLPVATTLPIPPERVLNAALAPGLERVLVVGWNPDGTMYFAGSHSDAPENLWLLELAKGVLLGRGSDE